MKQLDATIVELDGRDDVGCMVLTGADPAFCAGFDLRSLSTELRSVQQDRQKGSVKHLGLMPDHDTPVIGAINGAAVTGGLELAMCCDFLIASDRARFADTHARVGVIPGGGMTIRLPQLIGIDRARRMTFTGDFINAQTALDWGLVVEVVPHENLFDRAREDGSHHRLHPGREHPSQSKVVRRDWRPFRKGSMDRRVRSSRDWMAQRFDQQRLADERANIIARGAARVGQGHEGVRRDGPPAFLARRHGHAQRVEALGYDGLHVAETVHDALALSLLVAEHTTRITIRTSVALAFVRSPTLTAYAAWDLAKFSAGRFQLGLGTQIRQNIEERYAMPYGADPISQLRDYVGAVRAAFSAFQSGDAPHFESEHYSVTRLQPYFNPVRTMSRPRH